MADLNSSVALEAACKTKTVASESPNNDDIDVKTALLFLQIFKEHRHIIDKSYRDFWKVVTEKCHEAKIFLDKDSTSMYMDIWPGFVDRSKANFLTDTQTEVDRIVMDIVVSRKPNSFEPKPRPRTVQQKAAVICHSPETKVVKPETQSKPKRKRKVSKRPFTKPRLHPRSRATMASSNRPPSCYKNVDSNGRNVLITNPPPLPAAVPNSALGFHDNRTPTETIIALMQGIRQGLSMQHASGQAMSFQPLSQPHPMPTHSVSKPILNLAPKPVAPVAPVSGAPSFFDGMSSLAPPPVPSNLLPPFMLQPPVPPPAPHMLTNQDSVFSFVSNPPPSVQPIAPEAMPVMSYPNLSASSSESNVFKVPDNLNFLQYLIAGTTFNVPFGGFPALPSWMTLPPPPPNAAAYNLTPQQIHFEAMRTGMLMNQANPGLSFGGKTPQKLADLFGYSGNHSWVPNQAQPTPNPLAFANFPFANKATTIHSDTSAIKAGDFLNSVQSNASCTSSSLFSTSSIDPLSFASFSSSNTEVSADTPKEKPKSPVKLATPTFTESLPQQSVEKDNRAVSVTKSVTPSKVNTPKKPEFNESGNNSLQENSCSTTPKQKPGRKLGKRKPTDPLFETDSELKTTGYKKRRLVSPRLFSPKKPVSLMGKTVKKRGFKAKRLHEMSTSPPPCSSFVNPVRQSMRVAIRNSLVEDKSDVTPDKSSTSLTSKTRRTRSVAAPNFAYQRVARSRTCAKLVLNRDEDD